jgi:nitrilase
MRVAAAQAASVWLDPTATTNKVLAMLEQASCQGVELVAFPETFLSGYPFWVMLGGAGRFGGPEYARAYAAYLAAAVDLMQNSSSGAAAMETGYVRTASGACELAA